MNVLVLAELVADAGGRVVGPYRDADDPGPLRLWSVITDRVGPDPFRDQGDRIHSSNPSAFLFTDEAGEIDHWAASPGIPALVAVLSDSLGRPK